VDALAVTTASAALLREERDACSMWWQNAPGVIGEFYNTDCESRSCDWYRIVDGFVGIDSEDPRLRIRFERLYGECLSSSPPAPENPRRLHCRVRVSDGAPALVIFSAPEEVDIVDFILAVFRDRGYVEMHQAATDWRALGLDGKAQPLLAAKGARVLVDATAPWQPLIASCAINWAMRMQPELLFFHAAAVGIDGAGVLMAGDKGGGKTTLSMALAASGHAFLGDEIAAVRPRTQELASFRRAVSIRPGLRSTQVQHLLDEKSYPTEQFPDDTTRIRVRADDLFPPSGASLPIQSIFFLGGFEDHPRAEAFVPRAADLHLLTPLPCAFWRVSPAQPLMRVAKLLSNVNCYRLRPGSPEETAKLVERIVRTS
jgi:hypothetical protein